MVFLLWFFQLTISILLKMKNIISIFIFLLSYSFADGQEINKNDSLRFVFKDGYFIDTLLLKEYNLSSNNINFLKSSIHIFFNDNNVMLCNLGISDTDSTNFEYITQRILLKNFYGISWGKFKIENNLIKVHFYYQFFVCGLKMKYFETYFEGIIRDENTIVNWRMVAPYPNVNKRLNENFEYLKMSKILKFVSQKGVKSIHSDKAWINTATGR